MKKNILFSLFISLFATQIWAQTGADNTKKWAAIINVGHQTNVVNFDVGALQTIHKINLRPRFELGMERTWKEKPNFRFFQDAKLTFAQDAYVERAYGVGTDVGFEFKIFEGLRITPRLGAHFNLAKATDVQYKYNGEKWEPIANTSPSESRLYAKGGLDVSYRFMDKIDIIAGGHMALSTPYIKDAVPIFLHKSFNVGARYFF
jgi:hypothetical protein